jgi:hypothetical protein
MIEDHCNALQRNEGLKFMMNVFDFYGYHYVALNTCQ